MEVSFTSFSGMLADLPTELECREYLEMKRWGNTPVCPHCGILDANHYRLRTKGTFNGLYKCRSCKDRFTVRVGTIFEGSPISMRQWFITIYLFSAHKKGISSYQLARDVGVTQKTAWFMLHRIRLAFKDADDTLLGGAGVIVEADTTLVGGRAKNMHMRKRNDTFNKARGGSGLGNKTVVAGFIERGGKLRIDVVKPDEQESEKLKDNVDTTSILMTDSAASMRKVGREYAFHGVVDHEKGEYVKEKIIHTNTIEGVFGLFDRMVIGIYHSISKKHMQAYCDEFSFRYNARKVTDRTRFDMALSKTNFVKLKYAKLISK